MTRSDFQKYKKDKRFPKTIFREYFEEVCDTKWDEMSFMLFVENQSMFNRNYLADIINKVLIPFYNEKFKIYPVFLLDVNGLLIRELNEITEEN